MDDNSDNSLAFQAAAGHLETFAELLKRHYDRIYRVSACVLFGESELAADTAQDVCLKLQDKLADFEATANPSRCQMRVVI